MRSAAKWMIGAVCLSLVSAAAVAVSQTEAPQAPSTAPIAPPTEDKKIPTGTVVVPPTEVAPTEPVDSAPASASSDIDAEHDTEQPQGRVRYGSAVLRALDKVTTQTLKFEAQVDRPVRFKGLVFTVKGCQTTAKSERPADSMAYVVIRSEPRVAGSATAPARQIFEGWMYANAPGLHALEHPVYDAWLVACKTPLPSTDGANK